MFLDLRKLHESWQEELEVIWQEDWFINLADFLQKEYASETIYPEKDNIWTAFRETPFDKVKVVILGQDPYHGFGQAHGLSFSVQSEMKIPPSLRNVFRELEDDLGIPKPLNGNLLPWAKEGVLLLNTILTVQEKKPLSHKGKGWERFTDFVLQLLAKRSQPVVFMLWGNDAQKKKPIVSEKSHFVIEAAHPSPLARIGFLGSRPFSKCNAFLINNHQIPVNWDCLSKE